MKKYLEKSGKTEDEALAAALRELGLDRDDVSVEIVERAKSGFLGIGSSPAVVRVEYEVPDEEPAEAPATQESAPAETPAPEKPKKAEAPAKAPAGPKYTERENGGLLVNLSGPGMGAVIGRRGETLDAIQHLTNYAINRGGEKRCHINVDAESYRAKREESLVHLAEKMAAKVVKYKRSMALEPMNSYERHVIHTALQNFEGVSTSSTGTEPNRRVVVSYERPNRQEDTRPKSREWS